MRSLRVFLPLAVLTASLPAMAEEPGSSSDSWNIVLGAGAVNLPRYPGSRIDYTRGLPAVSISNDRFFIGGAPGGGGGPAGLGAYLVRTEHWTGKWCIEWKLWQAGRANIGTHSVTPNQATRQIPRSGGFGRATGRVRASSGRIGGR